MRVWLFSCGRGYGGVCEVMKELTSVVVLVIMMALSTVCARRGSWETPGCHLLGHVRNVTIPGCMSFPVMTNACRGYCTSYAFPSPTWTLKANPNHIVTSRAECCSIMETHDVHVNVRCFDGTRRLTFKSALSCACSICRNG